MNLDKLDRDILFELEMDSSQPTNLLGKKLKKSKDVIAYRIHRLRKENILRSCTAIVDMTRLGYIIFRVYIKWQNMDESMKKAFYDDLSKKEFIWTIAILHGKWDFAIFIGLKNELYIENFHNIWQDILKSHKEKITDHKIAIYSPIYNFNKRFFSDDRTEIISRVYGNNKSVEYDDLDLKLVQIYSQDVRQSLIEMANKTKTSIETVRRRIKDLEKKKIIVGYKIDLNLPKLGYQGYRVDFSLNSISRLDEIIEYIQNHKYFYQINKSIGGADL
jgi:DNA-binding Lrp family transcriptional regulator